MVYLKRSDGVYASFEGMTLDAVSSMLAAQGLTFDVLTEEQWDQRPKVSL